MKSMLTSLIDSYVIRTDDDYENALREIIQHLSLLGLWRHKFFEHAAFYGGTALRMFYGLPRFSEDIDFSLLTPDFNFNIQPFLKGIENELASYGFHMCTVQKQKQTNIKSAFIKGNTIENLLVIEADPTMLEGLPKNKTLKVRFELDIDPPGTPDYDVKTMLLPFPFQVRLFSLPDLFAGKLHAVLYRKWKERVKGRDFFDMIWYIGKKVPCNLKHLQSRMEQTNDWQRGKTLRAIDIKILLKSHFASINIENAKNDIIPFISDHAAIALWSREFFEEHIGSINFFNERLYTRIVAFLSI